MAHFTQDHVRHLYDTFGELKVLDDIIQYRATDDPPTRILGYPRAGTADDYETFTGHQLNGFIDAAAKHLHDSGIRHDTVAIFAPSDVDFVVTLFALSRLGCTVLCLSLRLPPVAIVNLLRKIDCNIVVHGRSSQIESAISALCQEVVELRALHTPTRATYDIPIRKELQLHRTYSRDDETNKIALIMHSSGSTGLPKPVYLSHSNVLCHPLQGAGVDNFSALPLYHMYGISTMLQAMYMKRTAYLFNQSLPMTSDNLIKAIDVTRPQAVHTVPYALSLTAEKGQGVEILRNCKFVTASSSRTPDELGNRLVQAGVNFGVVYGTTECGLAGDSMYRTPGDDSWNYIRLYPNVRNFVDMQPVGDGHYECVYLEGHPGLSASALQGELDGSWRSKDIFIRHPTIPDAWKYVTRADDRITLLNGEKVLPLPIEGCIRESSLVREAVVAGIGRSMPALLLFKSHLADCLSDDEFIDSVWPVIKDANSRAEGFSQITKDMICVFSSDVNYPHTDKRNIIRAQVYRDFAPHIDGLYQRMDSQEGSLQLNVSDLETFIGDTYEDIVGSKLPSLEIHFFNAGIDSLKALQMKRMIQKTIDLRGCELSANVVYEQQNAKGLAQYLYTLSTGGLLHSNSVLASMEGMVTAYSIVGDVVLLTGATGSLGSHLLAQLLRSEKVHRVYCFVRAGWQDPMTRIANSLETRFIELDSHARSKVIALEADTSLVDFGLGESMMERLRREVTLVYHLAWPVNFNIPLITFEPHIKGLRNLVDFSLTTSRLKPTRLFFSSSISTAAKAPSGARVIPDKAIEDLSWAADTGYAQSKLVGEQIVRNAARAGAYSYVLRIGQIVGDTDYGVWNDGEFIPAMIRSALTVKKLPMLREPCSWLPVNTAATAIMEISSSLEQAPRPKALDDMNPPIFYNLVNPDLFPWDMLLEELKKTGLQFQTVPFQDWLCDIQKSAEKGDERHNSAIKLIDYYKMHYGSDVSEDETIVFETKPTTRDAAVLRSPPNLVEERLIQKFVERWLQRWK